ncbi:serine hydrolase domain-containing protein [Flavobacterium frigidarium]|uniref:serine hydrolase domain-containing protein n=1 Tax=Flavobacterium frigidarium TaxID=99286 RepID=UPI000425F7B2|nr:serine hydrolase domain-containing protein [Flavobacterium frigidarium]
MIFIKNVNILHILVFSAVISSCNQKNKSEITPEQQAKNTTTEILKTGKKLDPKFVTSKAASIAHFYNKNWPNNSMNGSILVAKDGQIIYEKYNGVSNVSTKDSITSTTPLHLASVSKVITATAVLKLIDQKKLTLDQKVTTLLKNFPYPDVTVKTLLNHRSGMRNYAYFTAEKGVWDRHKILSNQDILNIMATKNIKLEFKTDTRFTYCNTNFAMLALIIEKVTAKKYEEAMKELIFEPLNMTNTYVFDYERDKDTAVPSYRNNRKVALDYLDAIYGDKNIYSTARDLLKFDQGRNSPLFFNTKLLKEAYIGYSNEHVGKNNYGLGMRMINWPTGQNFYFHNGWWHGNTSSFITLPIEGVTIIALSNKFTRSTYKVRNLSVLFGDYPFKIDDDGKEE